MRAMWQPSSIASEVRYNPRDNVGFRLTYANSCLSEIGQSQRLP